jgi:hypothetical protein
VAEPVRIAQAARELQVRPGTVRSWLRRGAPCAEPGGHGPGRSARVDIDALRAWRGRSTDDAPLVAVDASALARGLLATLRAGEGRRLGLTTRQTAALLAATYWHLHREATSHPPAEPWPEQIVMLVTIATGSG